MTAPAAIAPPDPTPASPYDHLARFKGPWLTPAQAAACLGRTVHYVYAMIDEGKLHGHAPEGRKKKRHMITRRSVVAHLAATAAYDPAEFDAWFSQFIASLSEAQIEQIAARVRAVCG